MINLCRSSLGIIQTPLMVCVPIRGGSTGYNELDDFHDNVYLHLCIDNSVSTEAFFSRSFSLVRYRISQLCARMTTNTVREFI